MSYSKQSKLTSSIRSSVVEATPSIAAVTNKTSHFIILKHAVTIRCPSSCSFLFLRSLMRTVALDHYSNNSMTSVYTTQRQVTQSLIHGASQNLFASSSKPNQMSPYIVVVCKSSIMRRNEEFQILLQGKLEVHGGSIISLQKHCFISESTFSLTISML